jgi:hypothetical protein
LTTSIGTKETFGVSKEYFEKTEEGFRLWRVPEDKPRMEFVLWPKDVRWTS